MTPARVATPSLGTRRTGTNPSAGTRSTVWMSLGSLTVVSRYSTRKARPTPPNSPTTRPSSRLSILRGLDGEVGISALSTDEMFDVIRADDTWVSFSRVRSEM